MGGLAWQAGERFERRTRANVQSAGNAFGVSIQYLIDPVRESREDPL